MKGIKVIDIGSNPWDSGDYLETTVANVVDFSAWLSEQELSNEYVEALKNGNKYTLI